LKAKKDKQLIMYKKPLVRLFNYEIKVFKNEGKSQDCGTHCGRETEARGSQVQG
jgi:hypothetical protein